MKARWWLLIVAVVVLIGVSIKIFLKKRKREDIINDWIDESVAHEDEIAKLNHTSSAQAKEAQVELDAINAKYTAKKDELDKEIADDQGAIAGAWNAYFKSKTRVPTGASNSSK